MPAIAASVAGRADKPSDDCAEVSAYGDAVVVADGVGSAALGSLGSHTVVALVLGEVREAAIRGDSPEALGSLVSRRYGAITGGDRSVASTCLFALCCDDRVIVGQAGDGLAGVLLAEGWVALPSARGEWANQTEALPRASVHCRAWPRAAVHAVMLATDGVSDDLVPGREAELLSSLLDYARREGLPALEQRIRVWLTAWPTPGSTDDRSLAILIPEDP